MNRSFVRPTIGRLALLAAVSLAVSAAEARAQSRVVLPEGTVLAVRTDTALSSRNAREGTAFTTTVTDTVRVDGFIAIPEGSRIEGVIALVQPATDRVSGALGLDFTRLVLPSGRAYAIDGRLTSTDPAERRQIEAQGNARVVLVGGRTGAGAAIAGVGGSGNDPISGILGALGGLLSRGADVTVPAGTTLAVQLQTGLVLTSTGTATPRDPDAFTIYTSTEAIRAAQQALAREGYYRGTASGQLDLATQRALLEFQIDHGILATGNLDGRTASELGLQVAGSASLTAAEAGVLRRNSQALTAYTRDWLGVTAAGRLDPRRQYTEEQLELYFALSAFTDNTSLYELIVRASGHEDVARAGASLIQAAERVDEALAVNRPPTRLSAAWRSIQDDLRVIDPQYAGN